MDLGTIQYNVDADTTGVDKANKSIDTMADNAQKAGVAVDTMGKKVEVGGKAAAVGAAKAEGSFRNLRGVSQNLGWQLQDVAVQAQMGTSAFTIFAQQGSQMASAFGPSGALIGAFIAVAGAVGGVLFSSLQTTGEAMDEMADNAKNLVKEMENLSDIQRQIVTDALGYSIDDEVAKRDALIASVEKHTKSIENLNAQHGQTIQFATGERAYITEQIDNTEKITDATKELSAEKLQLLAIDRTIAELQDTTGGTRRIRELALEAELVGKVGEELYRAQAAQKGYSEGQTAEFVALNLYIDAQKEQIEVTKNLEKEKTKALKLEAKLNAEFNKQIDERIKKQKQAAAQEASRAASVAALLTGMEREIALINDSSKEAAILYDITNGIIKAKGDEAAQLLETARALDIANAAYKEQEELLSMLDEFDYDGSFDNLEGQAKEATGAIGNMFERIDQQASDMWVGMFDGFDGALDGLQDLFKRTLAEMAHEAITKPIILNIQQGGSGLGGIGAGLASPAGMIAAGAIVGAALISEWNASMEKGFTELTSEYKQANQSTGTLLASGNEKSQSIANSISQLEGISGDALDVNRQMLSALNNISDGIGKASAVFGRSGIEGPEVGGLGKTTLNKDVAGLGLLGAGYIVSEVIGGQFGAFIDGVIGGVSKAIYSKSKSVIDSGIEFTGQALADILAGGAVDALSYATVQTKKKVLGITTSNKSSTETEALTGDLTTQLGLVFESAGTALGLAAEAFGLDFDNYINKLIIDPQKLSLKDLSGDELTAEIEAFFSSTLDNWAGVLTDGSVILNQFQQVGEGAFETVIRLATELNQFNSYADALNLNFGLAGFSAVEASQNIAKAAGGFDQLNNSMAGYYSNFFDDSERAERQMGLLSSALSEIGIDAVPASRDAFRSLVEGIDLTTEAGQQQFGALINLQGVFAELVPATEDLTNASRSAADIATERLGLERELLTLQGDTAALRKLDRDALHESNRALYDQINALEAMKEISDEVRSLEQQYFELTASEAEKRNALMQSLLSDEARTIQENIYAWYDAQEAASAAAKAVEDAASAMTALANSSFSGLQKSINTERDRVNLIVSGAGDAKSALEKSIDAEKSALGSSYNDRISFLEQQSSAEREAEKAINDARKSSLKMQIDEFGNSIGALSSLFGDLNSTIYDMSVETLALTRARRSAAAFEVDAALRNAREGRGLPTGGQLDSALSILKQDAAGIYSTQAEMIRDVAITQNKLAALAGMTGTQLSAEERMLAALEAQLESASAFESSAINKYDQMIEQESLAYQAQVAQLDKLAADAQNQYDILTGIDTKTLSVGDALARFNESLLAADFTNAQEQLAQLDKIENSAQMQIDALNGIDTGIYTLNESFARYNEAMIAASKESQSAQLQVLNVLVGEVKTMRESSNERLDSITKSSASTASSTKSLYKDGVQLIPETV